MAARLLLAKRPDRFVGNNTYKVMFDAWFWLSFTSILPSILSWKQECAENTYLTLFLSPAMSRQEQFLWYFYGQLLPNQRQFSKLRSVKISNRCITLQQICKNIICYDKQVFVSVRDVCNSCRPSEIDLNLTLGT